LYHFHFTMFKRRISVSQQPKPNKISVLKM
jgi:hypothetical protein